MEKAIVEKATAIVPNFAERGSIGLRRWGGQLDEEFLNEWKGANRYKIIDQMRKNSPVVAAMLRVMTWILTSAKWTIEPDTPAENEPADFVQSCLSDLEQSWSEYLSEVLTFLPYGFSLHEVVNIRRPDGKIGWKRFGFRAQETVSQWKFDDKGYATGFVQSAPPDYKQVEIALSKCIHMRLTTEKASPEGESVLRAAYRPFYFGKNLEEVEAIGAERDLTGMPVMYLGEGCTMEGTNSHYAMAKDLVRNIRMDEQMGVVLPLPKLGTTPDGRGILLELLTSGGSKEFDTSAIITRYETRMAMSVLAQWLMLGMNSVGSYALSDDQSDFFRLGLEGTIRIIEEQFTRQAIRRLLLMNPGIEGNPKLVGRLSVAPDYSKFANAVNQLVTAQVLDPTDANVRTAVMDAMGMPHPIQIGPAETEDEPEPAKPKPPESPTPPEVPVAKGGTGSGNFGHAGIPGQVGGSASGGGAMGGWTRDTALAAKRLKESGGGRVGQLDWGMADDGKTIYAEHYVSGSAAGTIDIETGELSPSAPKWEARLAEVRNHIIEASARFADESELANLMDYPGKNARAIQSILDRRPELADKFVGFSKSDGLSKAATWESGLEKYKALLGKEYKTWYEDTAQKLDEAKPEDYDAVLAAALVVLKEKLKRIMREQLAVAFMMGAEDIVSPQGWEKFAYLVAENERYVDDSLIPDIARVDVRKVQVGGLAAILATFAALLYRVELYAGKYWHAANLGAGEKIERLENPPVRRVLDDDAKHCQTCPEKAGEYESWDAMVAQVGIPGDGSDACRSQCRCWAEVKQGRSWVRL